MSAHPRVGAPLATVSGARRRPPRQRCWPSARAPSGTCLIIALLDAAWRASVPSISPAAGAGRPVVWRHTGAGASDWVRPHRLLTQARGSLLMSGLSATATLLLTGGSRGVGAVSVLVLAARGATVIFTYREKAARGRDRGSSRRLRHPGSGRPDRAGRPRPADRDGAHARRAWPASSSTPPAGWSRTGWRPIPTARSTSTATPNERCSTRRGRFRYQPLGALLRPAPRAGQQRGRGARQARQRAGAGQAPARRQRQHHRRHDHATAPGTSRAGPAGRPAPPWPPPSPSPSPTPACPVGIRSTPARPPSEQPALAGPT